MISDRVWEGFFFFLISFKIFNGAFLEIENVKFLNTDPKDTDRDTSIFQ